jgi:hypothetical protein
MEFGRGFAVVCWLMIAEFLTAVWCASRHEQQYKKFPKQSHCRSRKCGDFQIMPMILDLDSLVTDR